MRFNPTATSGISVAKVRQARGLVPVWCGVYHCLSDRSRASGGNQTFAASQADGRIFGRMKYVCARGYTEMINRRLQELKESSLFLVKL